MKTLRLRRWLRDGRTLLVPLDHGVAMGPLAGLEDPGVAVANLAGTGAVNAFVMHKGTLDALAPVLRDHPDVATILHLNGSVGFSPDPNRKVMVSSVEDALRLGADGVSVHVNLGHASDPEMLADLGRTGSACQRWGLPLLAMMYIRGEEEPADLVDATATAARAAWELGADAVKVAHPGDDEGLARVVDGTGIPVLLAGGDFRQDTRRVLGHIRRALDAGAAGLAVGRNVFGRDDRAPFVTALGRMVHEGAGVDDVMAGLEH